MATPSAPHANKHGPVNTIWLNNDGEEISGQGSANERADKMAVYARAAAEGRENLRFEFNSNSMYATPPSTPTKGGSRRRRRSQMRPLTPPPTPRPTNPPSIVRRQRTNIPNENIPRILFPQQTRQTPPQQGGKKTKREKRSSKKSRRATRKRRTSRRRRSSRKRRH